jgi:hypothetical protein
MSTRNYVAELSAAEHRFYDAETAVRCAEDWIKTQEKIIASEQRKISLDLGTREASTIVLTNANTAIREASAKLATAVASVEPARTALADIKYEIKNHPLTAAAIAKQKSLVEKAVELAERAWRDTPILKIDAIKRQIENLADEELALLDRENVALREAHLPLLRSRITDEIMNMLPGFVWDYPIDQIARDAAAVRARVVAF